MNKLSKNTASILFLTLLTLSFVLAACGQEEEQPQDEIVVALPTATLTPTPFPTNTPTATPTNTPTATPTNTPTPTATPLPQVVLEVSGPEIVPSGLPQAATWQIEVVEGAEVVIISVEDLGGVMLTGDQNDQLDLVRSLVPADAPNVSFNLDSEWTINGIIDPNIGRGVMSLLVETAGFQETVTLPWITADTEDVQIQTYAIAMDGTDQEPNLDPSADIVISRPGFNAYETVNGLKFEYPQGWFVNEFQDGTVQLSAEPLGQTDGATPENVAYASVIAGDRGSVGIPVDVQLDPEAIIDWLLGDVTVVGGDQSGQFISDELEVVERDTLTLEDGSTTTEVVLRPVGASDDEETSFEARYIVSIKENDRLFILTAFDPEGSFLIDLEDVVDSIEIN